ncbi:hypothetical protein SAMN05421638_0511 [Kaistella treverensis]|uniref:Uncharacterized protein n=1 Tax=Kaistella treverensis TaxID=631455 RepID=A0A1I3K0E0_9FLAO|nr:hypothetical protein [Kaistella treverensis]SFI65906.1 hypothetical protein SAMN05421638_0511 [Kaistella treverensis]
MINSLRKEFEKVYFSNISTTKGLENLASNIGVSKNSLRRFLGKIKNSSQLRLSTLNLISARLGYRDFQDFCDTFQNGEVSLDFELLDIYYGLVKGEGTRLNDRIFQKANFYFAEKILSNPKNLQEFIKRFADNEEALEYVLAWHPFYEKAAQKEYQDALLKLVKITKDAHIKVFAYSFVFYGRFMSEKLNLEDAADLMKKIELQVVKMRKESDVYMAFPEARYTIAKYFYMFLQEQKSTGDQISASYELKNLPENGGILFAEQIIFRTYVSSALNAIERYEDADACFKEIPTEKQLNEFAEENPHLQANIFLYKITRAITLFYLGKRSDAVTIFESLPIDINDGKNFPFDCKIYFELQYYRLGKHLFPKREDLKLRFDFLIAKTQYTFLNRFQC